MFRKQITNGGPLTITTQNMTRFIMSVPKAVELVLKTAEFAQGGEIFILKMPALRIGDLAETMVEDLAPKYGYDPNEIEIKTFGRRAGEKLYEELMTEAAAANAYEDDEMFVILPKSLDITNELNLNLPNNFKKAQIKKYSTGEQKSLTKEEIKILLTGVINL